MRSALLCIISAKTILGKGIALFGQAHIRIGWCRSAKGRAAVPVIQGMRERAHALRSLELERARKLLARGESPEAVLEQFGQALTNKLLHSPVAALHHAADTDEAERARLLALFARFYPDADN